MRPPSEEHHDQGTAPQQRLHVGVGAIAVDQPEVQRKLVAGRARAVCVSNLSQPSVTCARWHKVSAAGTQVTDGSATVH